MKLRGGWMAEKKSKESGQRVAFETQMKCACAGGSSSRKTKGRAVQRGRAGGKIHQGRERESFTQ